ncbi:MAG TPA: 2-isopropylmalate synthase [Thermomicrobiales bacterium]|nr:2-isopropylmalate synthase [Thermomicrobiales bacterium]
MSDRVLIFDTTLRDGEQSPGATMTTPEKIEVARQLVRLGVDIIEAGYPNASPGDLEAVQMIGREVKGAVVAGLARVQFVDIDAAWEGVRYAESPRIHTFVSSSPIHMEFQLRKRPEEVLEMARAAVRRCKGYLSDVQFSAMDATRSDWDFLCRMFEAAIEEGATTLNIPDTVGYTTPEEFTRLINYIRERTRGVEKAVLSVHCHNDLGLATANTLAAVKAGVRQVEVTINGLGERAGNTALEEVVMALKTRKDYYGDVETRINTQEIVPSSRIVSRASSIPVQPNKAIVGANAFAHESGIHQDGMIKHRDTYEIMTPESVGWGATKLVLGKHSGRAGFRAGLQELGYEVEADRLQALYLRFIELTDRKKHVADADLIAIVEDELQHEGPEPFHLLAWQAHSGSDGEAEAAVIVGVNGVEREATGRGNGQIDALYSAIDSIVGIENVLQQYHIDAVTPGEDAQGAVMVRILVDGNVYAGHGVATDIVESSVRAYLTALNRAAVAVQVPLKAEGVV